MRGKFAFLAFSFYLTLIVNGTTYSDDASFDPLFKSGPKIEKKDKLSEQEENTRLFGTVFSPYFPQSSIPSSKIEEVEIQLAWVSRRLQSFVPPAGFIPGKENNMVSFGNNKKNIQNMLQNITIMVLHFPPSKILSAQLTFAQRVFLFMASVNDELMSYKVEVTGEYLVCGIIQVNMRLLVFYDSQGVPRLMVQGQVDEINRYLEYLKYWKEVFLILPHLPLSLSLMFESQYTQAQMTIKDLVRMIPSQTIPGVTPPG